ncbi:hypothetical protein YC2023_121043 [Brassica napus]
MSPSSLRRRTSLKNFFNFKGQNNDADIEEGVGLVYDGRDKYNIPRTWSLTNLLTPRKFKQTESLPFMIKLHPWSKRERTLPIRRTRSVPTLIDNDGNVKPSGLIRVIPTSRGDTKSLDMMHASKTSNLNC